MGLGNLAALTLATLLLAPPATAETVYLISGGYVSCRTGWSAPTDAPVFQTALRRIRPTAYVAACYRSNSTVISFVSDRGEAPRGGDVPDLIDAVRERMSLAEPGSRLVIIGHSYGGWAAIRAAETLIRELDVVYLATIDPVSPVGCPPSAYMGVSVPYGPCTEAPADLAERFAEIRDRGVTWVQFYQDRYRFLRSTPIAEATRNVYLAYPDLSDLWAWQAHAIMDGDERVWDVVVNDLPESTRP